MRIRLLLGIALLTLGAARSPGQSLIQRSAKIAPPMTNPLASHDGTRQAGAKLFKRDCAYCHGEAGKGNGRRRTPPLATNFVVQANPGTLFWVLKNGSENGGMPSFAHMPEPQRWQIITYLQTLK